MGGLFALCRDSRNLVAEVRGIDIVMRSNARGAIMDDTAALRSAHQSKRRGHRMSAAFRAARNMDRNAASPMCQLAPQSRREFLPSPLWGGVGGGGRRRRQDSATTP